MDRINQRFGRTAVSVGALHGGRLDHVGSKIAFGRIPELDEFHE
jgi:DNA polymerase-4